MSITFNVIRHSMARSYLDACEAALLKTRPTQANLSILSARYIAASEIDSSDPTSESERKHFFYTITLDQASPDGGSIILAFAQTHPFPAVLGTSVDPSIIPQDVIKGAMKAFVDACILDGLSVAHLQSTVGPKAFAESFAHAWAVAYHLEQKKEPILHMYNTYVTKDTLRPSVRPKLNNRITLGKVQIEELNAAAVLVHQYNLEEQPRNHTIEASTTSAKGYIDAGEMFGIWDGGELRGFAVLTRPTPGVKAFAYVYTAPKMRGQGLAEAVVRYACEQ
jgi:hypothetical protein